MSTNRKVIYEEEYPYTRADYMPSVIPADVVYDLMDKLPHGSGIDYTWNIYQQTKQQNRFTASNSFHSMCESGMYCHVYDFTFTLIYNGKGKTAECQYCKGKGYRLLSEIQAYHPNMTEYNLRAWLIESGMKFYTWSNFVCNVCHGKGDNPIPEWDIIRLNWHGQKEYQCCGFGLKDYLYQTMELALHA